MESHKTKKPCVAYKTEADRRKFRAVDAKWVGNDITGPLASVEKRLRVLKRDDASPLTQYVEDALHDIVQNILRRRDELDDYAQEERAACEARQRQIDECQRRIAAARRQIAEWEAEIARNKQLNADFARDQVSGPDATEPRGVRALTQQSLEPPKSRRQAASIDIGLFVDNQDVKNN